MSWAEERQGWAAGHLGAIPEAPEDLGKRRARSTPVVAAAAAAAATRGAEHGTCCASEGRRSAVLTGTARYNSSWASGFLSGRYSSLVMWV